MNIAHIKYLWKRDFTKSNKSLNKGSAPFIYAILEKLPPLGILACWSEGKGYQPRVQK